MKFTTNSLPRDILVVAAITKSIEESVIGISQCRMATSDSNGRFGIEEETVSGF